MAVPGSGSPLLFSAEAAAPAGAGFKSLRFNPSDSAYLSRTPSSSGNRRTFTTSMWLKRSGPVNCGVLGQELFRAGNSALSAMNFAPSDGPCDGLSFKADQGGISPGSNTNAVFRDFSAWMHIVYRIDTTQATAADRVRIYVNNVQQSWYAANYPSQNQELKFNQSGQPHYIGGLEYLNGYLAQFAHIDGSSLAPSSFAEYDTNNVWVPKADLTAESLSFGTNGFLLTFADNSSASALGTDSSGNGNDWTVNNISIGPSYITGSTLATPLNAFDGSTSTYTIVDTTTRVLTNESISVSSQLEIYSNNFDLQTISLISGGNTYQFEKHPSNYYTVLNNANSQNNTPFTGTLSGPISIVRSAGSASFYAVRVDGTILVDNSSGIDSLFDSPTNGTQTDTGAGGEVSGNYATLNPLDANSSITLSQGNLHAAGTTAGFRSVKSTIAIPNSDKWYFEGTTNDLNGLLGVATAAEVNTSYVGATTNGWGFQSGGYYNSTYTSGVSFSAGDILNFAVDRDNQKIWFGVNGTWVGSGNPATGANATFTNLPADSPLFGMFTVSASGKTIDVNFGQRAFAYTAPSGFKALCTANFDTPTIEDPSTVMDVVTYTGDGVDGRTITTSLTTVGAVWIKNRSISDNHRLATVVQGGNAFLSPNLTGAENNATSVVQAFSNNTFDIGTDTSVNGSGNGIVAWTWDAGTSTASNTSGTITSQVRANISAGFSIVTYTGVGYSNVDDNFTVGHGLGVKPAMIIIKKRSATGFWPVWHTAFGDPAASGSNTKYIILSSTGAQGSLGAGYLYKAASTSSVFGIGVGSEVNGSGSTFVAYCWAPVEGYSAFGSYTGNGSSTSGPFVYTGFRPKWLMVKVSNQADNWVVVDAERNTYNSAGLRLFPNTSGAESSFYSEYFDLLSNGFKARSNDGGSNASNDTYIWAAFAESPFAYARAR